MNLFRKRIRSGLEGLPKVPAEILRDGVLLSRWFIVHELDKEIERARRHERPLTAVVLRAQPSALTPEQTDAVINGAAGTAMTISRSTDLISWLPDCGILVVMPETDGHQARAAAYRWREEMYLRGCQMDAPRWDLEQVIDPLTFPDANALLAALTSVTESVAPPNALPPGAEGH